MNQFYILVLQATLYLNSIRKHVKLRFWRPYVASGYVATKASYMTGFKTLRGAIYKSHRKINKPYMVLYSKVKTEFYGLALNLLDNLLVLVLLLQFLQIFIIIFNEYFDLLYIYFIDAFIQSQIFQKISITYKLTTNR